MRKAPPVEKSKFDSLLNRLIQAPATPRKKIQVDVFKPATVIEAPKPKP